MNEFLFGHLSTPEKRLEYERERRRGVRHDYCLQPAAPRPGEQPTAIVSAQLPQALERVVCTILEPEQTTVKLHLAQTEWDVLNWAYAQTWQGLLPAYEEGTTVRYIVQAYPAGGGDPILADGGECFSYQVGEPGPPDWAAEAIVYQIFPDRFHPGGQGRWRPAKDLAQVHGGTLRGIIERLDYVADLGFNCIWLNPILPDDTHHHYHAIDYFQVDPGLGTLDDARELVQEAHRRGIRVLLDFVANHWGRGHPTFQSALRDRHSEYAGWYFWEQWPERYQTFHGVRDLPRLNTEHPGVRDYLFRAATFWLEEVGVDGYRLDFAQGPGHDFWRAFRQQVRSVRPDAWIFGEVVETPQVQLSFDGRLDGTLDFLLMQALRDTFAFNTMSVAALDRFLRAHEQFFPDHFSRPSFLDNHDITRFLWLVDGDRRKLKLAALCQFTLAGPPIVYYGTEVGLSQDGPLAQEGRLILEKAREPMLWGGEQDGDLRRFYRRLIYFRREHPVLCHGERRTVHVDDDAGTFAYTRSRGQETILVALNVSDRQCQLDLSGRRVSLGPWSGTLLASNGANFSS